ncbi:hypothetical protein [Undibacterium fentianense]|uniref:Uncharacterized protein n=1 Tax=Undibacterium fentianense TaxID=2828728 RepID=A0A941E247_9BURK|nr:hypothetical protein [Undibacterium fentianense]MBR7799259.1 hypothetical protein [Undibacterium fentianense]
MQESAFFEIEFYVLILLTFLLPIGIYWMMLKKRSISKIHVLAYGIVLVLLSALNVVLLRLLHDIAMKTPSLADEKLFASEISIALYVVPAIFAGIGINIISHVLIEHLKEAERNFSQDESTHR